MSASRMITSLIGAFGGGALGRMLGGRTGGMIGSVAGSMLSRKSGGIGSLLGGFMGGKEDQVASAAAEMTDDDATLFIRAMCSAAKADGVVDDDEIDRIVSQAGDLDADDETMLRRELNAPLDLAGLIASVPSGLEADIYAASLLPIKVDETSEVEYLQQLATGLGLDRDAVAQIHQELGLN